MYLEQLRKYNFFSIGAITMFLFPFGTFFQSLGMAIFCVQLIYFILISKRQKPRLRAKSDTSLFLFCVPFVVYCCYAPWAYDKSDAYEYLLRTSPILFLPILLSLSKIAPDRRSLKEHFVLGSMFSVIFSLLIITISSVKHQAFSIQNFVYYNLAESMSMHPTYYSLLILTAIVFVGSSSVKFSTKQRLLLFCLFTVFLLLLQVRTVIFLYVILVLIKGISIMRKDRKMAYVIFILVPAMMVMLTFGSARYKEILTSDSVDQLGTFEENGIVQRIWLWNSTISAVKDKPIFGYGLRSQRALFHKMVHKEILGRDIKKTTFRAILENSKKNAHSQYLQWLFDFGFLGFTFIVLSFVILFIEALKSANTSFLLLLIPFFVIMLTENLLDRQVGIYYWSLILPLAKISHHD